MGNLDSDTPNIAETVTLFEKKNMKVPYLPEDGGTISNNLTIKKAVFIAIQSWK